MAGLSQLIVFGDQAVPYTDELRRLMSKRADYTLAALLGEAYHALRADISRLPSSQRTQFPAHSNLSELLTAHASSATPNCALDSALAVLHQITSFVSYFSQTGRETEYPKSPSTTLIGSCIGLLSALAISSSETIGELVQITPEIVVLAFRLGLVVQNKTGLVLSKSSSSSSTSTSYAVASLDKSTASSLISSFYESRPLSLATRVYVSAIGNGNVTLSGPPGQLEDFLSQHQSLKSARIAMNGLFHSAALYEASNVATLLETAVGERLRSRVCKLDIISNSEESQEAIAPSGGSVEQTLPAILSEILLRQMRWDLVTQRAAELSRSSRNIAILPFATGSVQGLATAIGQGDSAAVDIVDTNTSQRPAAAAQVKGRRKRESGQSDRSKIAIIGYSGRFPEADSNEEFWQLFLAGLDVVKEIPKDRFDPSLYFDPTGKKKNTSGVTKGCFVKNPDLFDSRFFGMSPREAEQADPAQRLALTTAYEAMEMAGFVPDSSPSTQRNRVGVFYGTASDDYREVNAAQNVDTYFVPGGSRAFLPARINYYFSFSGPSFDVDTACSSGLAAVHIACNSLWMGDCDVAIAGGTNILTNPDNWAGLDRAHFLSHTGNCKTFDDGADGYCRAESVATVLLKRLDDALLDGDPIQGVILGALTNHSAEAVSITRPHSGAQRAIFSRILDTADVDSSDVSYVEMHGTGTQHGDACEMDSVLSVFAPDERSRKSQPLYLGSAKANIGHAESASGITSLIKVLLMMEKSQIPRHVGIKTKINHNFPTNLPQRNVHIAMQTTPWPRPSSAEGDKRLAFVNNFGAAGGNSSVLLEDAPRSRIQSQMQGQDRVDPRPLHVVAVSAKSQSALKKNIRALVDHLEDDTPLGSLSYTTTARRLHYNFRVAVTGKNIAEIRQRLEAAESKEHFSSQSAGKGAPVGFCFTGQGAQYLGMGKRLYEVSPRFRAFITGLDEIVRLQGFDPILPVIDGTCPAPKTLETLPPATVQLATTCLQMALGKFWKALGIAPLIVVGHSLGEYAALNLAGVLSDADTIYLVGTRAKLLEKHCTAGTHSMLAAKASASKVASLIASDPDLEICCANGPEETVVGGPTSKIEAFAASLARLSIKATLLKVQFAFHSAQVEPMLSAFQQSCSSIKFNDPSVSLLSPLLSKVITSASDLGSPSVYLSRHCRETVNFSASLVSAKALATDKMVWVEIGSHPICSNSIKASLGQTSNKFLPTLRRGEDDWSVMVPTMSTLYESGLALNWDDYHTGFKDSLKVLRLPRYQWDLKSHWIPYTHDWLLTKGDAPVVKTITVQGDANCQCHLKQLPAVRKKVPLSTSVQDLISEVHTATESSITARSDVQDPPFAAILRGHRVNGQPVCSSAVYADMAMTLFARMLEQSRAPCLDKSSEIGIEVSDMVVDKSLILGANPDEEQLLEMKASVDWATRRASFTLHSINPLTGKTTANHCRCAGTFTPKSKWVAEWSRREYLIKSRIAHLRKSVADEDDSVCHLKTGMFYKLFSSLVDYQAPFKGCRELIMKSAEFESTGKVKFNAPPENGRWDWPPTWLDSIGQITGFTMNANDTLDSRAQVWINHGWENMKMAERLSSNLTYQTHVKMQPVNTGEDGPPKSYIGDVHIFNPTTGSIAGVYEGVSFSAVPRKILDKVLPLAALSAGAAVPAPRPPVVAAAAAAPVKPVLVQEKAAPVVGSMPKLEAPAAPALTPTPSQVSAIKLKTILAEEVGAPVSDVADDMELADLGVDSLLALTIADRLLEELGLKVDSTLLIGGLKVKELVHTVMGGDDNHHHHHHHHSSDSASSSDSSDHETNVSTPVTVPSSPKLPPTSMPDPAIPRIKCPAATSVLLQGVPYSSSHTGGQTKPKTLWLFPDGSGLATSYLPLPDIKSIATDAPVSIYGLNSPFVGGGNKTSNMSLFTFDDLVTSYMAEMRRRQPQGPYLVGGWSAGGVAAYSAAQRIVAETGDPREIAGLVLIDTPPAPLEQPKKSKTLRLPERLYDEFQRRNIFGTIGTVNSTLRPGKASAKAKAKRGPPEWLLQHFMGFAAMLEGLALRPWEKGVIKTWAVYASDGVDEEGTIEIREEDPDAMRWLLRRRDLRRIRSCNGWDVLVGGDEAIVEVEVVNGANHFTLMSKGDALEGVAGVLRRAVAYM